VLVTRAEEWCVEAETADEAGCSSTMGQGYRCQIGDWLDDARLSFALGFAGWGKAAD